MSTIIKTTILLDKQFKDILRLSIGNPFYAFVLLVSLPKETFTKYYIYLEPDSEELHFKVSQYLANVYRKSTSHQQFIELYALFGKYIEFVVDKDDYYIHKYVPYELKKQHKLCL